MMNSQLLANLNTNNVRLQKYQDMIASGKKLNKPSDDPVGVGYAMRYDAQINRNDQYQRNVDDARSQLDFLDSSINQLNNVLQRARELAVRGATGSMSSDDRIATSKEIKQIYEQCVTIGNSQFNGAYIFNGQITNVPPYSTTGGAEYSVTDDGLITYSLSEGVDMAVNALGKDVFGDPAAVGSEKTSTNIFAVLKTLQDGLDTNNSADIQTALGNLDLRMNRIQYAWSDVGARSNRAEMLDNRLKDLDVNLQTLLSKVIDTDIPETITNMKTAEAVQRSSLETGARIMQPTLMDFLK
jgi:flagellar hook-associated protein 3 FlgL